MKTQFGQLVTGDFDDNTLTIEIDGEMTLQAGRYAIVPIDDYNQQVKKCDLADVVGQSEQLKAFLDYCDEAGWIKNLDKNRVIKDYEQSL